MSLRIPEYYVVNANRPGLDVHRDRGQRQQVRHAQHGHRQELWDLTDTQTLYPGTNYHLAYTIKSPDTSA